MENHNLDSVAKEIPLGKEEFQVMKVSLCENVMARGAQEKTIANAADTR